MKSLLNAGNELPYAELMTSSRDSVIMIIVVFYRRSAGKSWNKWNEQVREGPTTIYGQNSMKRGGSSKSCKSEVQRGSVARRAVHEQRNKILSWLWAATGACLYVLRDKMGNGLRVWLLLLQVRLLSHRRVGDVHR